MTLRISLVAVCWSSASDSRFRASGSRFSASARCFSRSRTLESALFSDLRATGGLPSAFAFAGFAPRRIDPSLLLTAPYDRTAIDDRLGEDAPVGKWAGRLLDAACACNRVLGGLIQTLVGHAGGWGSPPGKRCGVAA